VRQGNLRFIQNTPAGSTRRRATLSKGDMFGSLDLVDLGFRKAQVSTETPVQLLVLRKQAFEKLMKFYPAMSSRLVTVLKQHLSQQYINQSQLLAQQSRTRIIRLLYHISSHPDYHPDSNSLLACPLREWAELTGSSSEAIELVMENLEALEIIKIKANGIKVINAKALMAESQK
jgi:CRP-like cAMP-binding protein